MSRTDAPPHQRLVDFLHDDPELRLTGTKLSCGVGACGACRVALQTSRDDPMMPVLGCYARLDAIDGMHITTVEGLAKDGRLHPLQQAFLDEYAFQCGFCTPGFLMSAFVLMENLRRSPVSPERLDTAIMNYVSGNLCRCTGYVRYLAAIRKVVLDAPGLVEPGAPGPGAISPSNIGFRVVKRSSNDLFDKSLVGFFEDPEGEALFAGGLDLDTCRAWLKATTDSIRTGERVRDLNLRRSLFKHVTEFCFEVETAEPVDPRITLGSAPQGTPVPIIVRGSLACGGVRLPIETDLLVRVMDGERMDLTSLAALRIDARELDLPIAPFAQEFGLRLLPVVEISLDARIPYRIL